MKLSSRMTNVRGEGAFEVLVKARALEAQGKDVVHMEIGEPDFPTAPHIVEAGKQALDAGYTKYGPTQGDPELRAAIAQEVSATRGVQVSEKQVVVTPGAKPILFYTMLALLEPGDEALYPNPGFPIYESMINYTGATPVALPLVEERGFSLDLNVLKEKLTDRSKLLILCSPQNPTGGSIPAEDIAAIADLVRERDLIVLADEIYSKIWFDEKPASIASEPGMAEKTILLDGFSKAYRMTGWRIGYGVMPQWLVDPICLLMVNSASHTASFTQRAAIAALQGPQDSVHEMVAEFKRRRDLIVEGFNQIPGFRCATPGGAFYAFPNVAETGIDSRTLADRILQEAGVACLAGDSFGRYGAGYLRFSYATAYEKIEIALDRINKLMRSGA
ncbi:MAG: aminotransferase class I/II-fold pyridoxal phosphate-dependent enzyme [Acidobacteria bacterium]|nr:aminotransferase class I/II-fold pyridoxal phosphate-dependent enzyme [Acidobacteriota bacterium]